ncbi:Dioxygenase cnsJ [Penicillium nucicola]|uniref:Dioxygenase cnsJ n=1 Tax=Penicillium nucicola TaxID=1850975 RepID=UPI0025456075|nr:Dioxygenase cnsJ [Penicillium nucicola]KAJ5766289.1 Dioxygenase cnsJ [Penicillium nucicola]
MTVTNDSISTEHGKNIDNNALPEVDVEVNVAFGDLIKDIIRGMEQTGVCIVRNMYSAATVNAVAKELAPYISSSGDYYGDSGGTAFVSALLTKSETFATKILAHKIFHEINDHFLTTRFGHCPVSTGVKVAYNCEPQIDCTLGFYIPPGGKAQLLHRDDADHLNFQPSADKYELGRDTGLVMMTALTKTTRENGATRVLPGSHLWDYALPFPEQYDNRMVDAELNPGDSFFTLTSVIHGGGNNTTSEGRFVTSCFVTRAHCRQLENQFLSYDVEKVRQLPVWLQRFMGYTTAKPFCGWVDKKDPLRVINPDAENFRDGWPESED